MSERKSRDELAREFLLAESDVRSNVFYVHHDFLAGYDAREPEIKELQEKLSVARAALENIAKGTHEEFPTCMIGKNGFDYGPPRTGGWEGWARELRACNIEIAREALEKIKVT